MLRFFRRLAGSRARALLIVFLVPVVVLATPGTASAASTGTMTFSLIGDGLETSIPGVGNTTCQIPWSRNAGGLVLGSSSRCDGGPDYSPGHCQPFEGACGSFGLVVKGMTGETCGSSALDPFDIGGGIGSVKAGLGGGYVVLPSNCVPVEACLSYYFQPSVGGATDVSDCVPISVDGWDDGPPETFCTKGTVEVPKQPTQVSVKEGNFNTWRGTWLHGGSTAAAAPTGGQWVTYVVLDNADGNSTGSSLTGATRAALLRRANLAATPGAGWAGGENGATWSAQFYVAGGQNFPIRPVLGVGAFYLPAGASTSSGYYSVNTGGLPNPRIGITDPANCAWYWGTAVSSDPVGDASNVPAGAVLPSDYAPTPPVTPEVVAPVDDTPDTDTGIWAGILALLRAIAAVIGQVLTAVKNLAAAIVNGIRDALSALFLPSDGYLESKWSGVESKWQGTSPGRYLAAFDDFSPGTVSGCSGLPLNVDLGGGVRIDEHIGAACSGSMATAAGITRVAMIAVFSVAGTVACVRAIGSGLGWDPGIGRGGAA